VNQRRVLSAPAISARSSLGDHSSNPAMARKISAKAPSRMTASPGRTCPFASETLHFRLEKASIM
jgi:hypothetical protein